MLPHASGAWIDHEKTKVGYVIPFCQHFHIYAPSYRALLACSLRSEIGKAFHRERQTLCLEEH